MVAIYVKWIKKGLMNINEVPTRWREAVISALG